MVGVRCFVVTGGVRVRVRVRVMCCVVRVSVG